MNNPLDPSLRELNDCGCCSGTTAETPVAIENRPGLDAIDFRAGLHPQFKASMLAVLTAARNPALRNLKTRDDDDLTIALLDGWGTVADVLSFYSERIANESFLRTATERRSIVELARSIGYELNPGVAASTWLAFTIEDVEGAPGYANVDAGTQVQSIPGPNETPQVFETLAPLLGRKEWNALRPQFQRIPEPVVGMKELRLKGADTGLKNGDALLIVGDERARDTGNGNWDFRRVSKVDPFPDPDPEKAYTIVTLDRGLGSSNPSREPAKANAKVFALRTRANFFGYNAPDWRAMPESIKDAFDPPPSGKHSNASEWPGLTLAGLSDDPIGPGQGTGLYGEYFGTTILQGRKFDRTDAQINFDWSRAAPAQELGLINYSVRWSGWVEPRFSGTHTLTTNSDDGVRLWIDGTKIIDNWTVHGAALDPGSIELEKGRKYHLKLEFFQASGDAVIQLFWAYQGQAQQLIPQSQLYPRDPHMVHLDAVYPGIVPGGCLVVATADDEEVFEVMNAVEDARANFNLAAKTTRLTLRGENLEQKFNDQIREASVFAQSEELPWALEPIHDALSGDKITLDENVLELPADRALLVSGLSAADGTRQVETVIVKRAEKTQDGLSRLILAAPLKYAYDPTTTIIYGNTAFATHGETTDEVLGSGDANQPHQRFVLKQTPLTYTPAASASGGESSLAIWVDDVKWREVPTLFGAGRRDRVYVVRIADDGKATVLFGDGKNGARLPTGHENVRAVYRKGIGHEGLLMADQLTLLLTQPLGLKSVTNPEATGRGVDPQVFADARENAPLTVLTLDRVVSLQDYEDFARNFNGVAKALATWTWNVNSRGVFLTVAGLGGVAIAPDSSLRSDLLKSLRELGNPLLPIEVRTYTPVSFKLGGTVFVDSDRVPAKVEAAVKEALKAAFSFDARSFGQPLALSEVEAVIQNVAGVAFVDLDALYLGNTATRDHYLAARKPDDGAAIGTAFAAELLTLDETSLSALKAQTV
jgi:hypothetical protein